MRMVKEITFKCPQCRTTDYLVYDWDTACWRCRHCYAVCIPNHEPDG